MLNKVMLIGRVGQYPERKETTNSTVVHLSVATTEHWQDKSGEKKERTEWHKIVVWGKLADICASFVRKGKLVYIEGRIQTRNFEDKQGAKRTVTEINADTVQFLD